MNVCTPEFLFPYLLSALTDSSLPYRFAGVAEGEQMALWRLEVWRRIDRLAGLGGQLVDLHARGHGEGKGPSFPIKGDNVIEEVRYQAPQPDGSDRQGGRVWINERQHFEPVPPEAWAHPIGGYQPAERWLKDRIGRTLGYDDLIAYARIIHALRETRRLMSEIDETINVHGGWPKAFVPP